MTASAKGPERMGEVTAPSGVVLIVDTGLLHFWSHDRVPVMREGDADPETVTSANSQVDFRIDGPDAAKAGRAFDRQGNPLYLFDIPAHGIQTIERSFAQCVQEHGLDARLVQLPERVSHRRRIDLLREVLSSGGEIIFQGIWASVVPGVPSDVPLAVFGERMPAGPDAARWRSVWLECRPGGAIASSEQVGYVAVDQARLMFADVDALGAWRHDEPLDGLADFLFWGKDAKKAARRTKAPRAGKNQWGWVDLPVREAVRLGRRVERLKDKHGWKMATDFRPHSHHYQVMEQVCATPTESGTVEVGGARMCTFMTSWGDGCFPVFRDLDVEGRLVRIRIDLGNEQIVLRQRKMEERFFGAFAKLALVSRRVAEGHPVCWLYREESDNDGDSGWRIFAGDEDDDYLEDADNCVVLPLRDLIDRDRDLEEVFRSPVRSAFERKGPDDPFASVADFFDDAEDEESP